MRLYNIDEVGCAETPPHECRGVLIGSPSIAFTFGVQTLHSWGPSQVARPLAERGRSNGTCTVTIQASPTAEEVHAPRPFPGVCASREPTQRVVHLARLCSTRSCFYLLPCATEPLKRD